MVKLTKLLKTVSKGLVVWVIYNPALNYQISETYFYIIPVDPKGPVACWVIAKPGLMLTQL